MKIIKDSIKLGELREMATRMFGNLVKAVVDIEKQIMAVDAEMHSDEEGMLLENGSKQSDLWGINIYPKKTEGDFIEFDSMINLRPSQNNRSRGVESSQIRAKIIQTVSKLIEK
jgi:hypothetical protein